MRKFYSAILILVLAACSSQPPQEAQIENSKHEPIYLQISGQQTAEKDKLAIIQHGLASNMAHPAVQAAKQAFINNGYLGMVRQLQDKFCDGRYSETKISNPDFVKLAQSYGLPAMRVNSYDEINSALEFAFNTKGTVIVDFVVEPLESV